MIQNGNYVKVKDIDIASGAESCDDRAALTKSGGKIELRFDSRTGTIAGTCTAQGTGGWQIWATKSCAVTGANDISDLDLKFAGGDGMLFNFNWWKLYPIETEMEMENKVEHRKDVNIMIDVGNSQTLRVDFSQPVLHGKLNVCLFDLSGRPTATLFTGEFSFTDLTLPLNRATIRPSTCLVRVLSINIRLIGNDLIVIQPITHSIKF
jgi:hypothetical protein